MIVRPYKVLYEIVAQELDADGNVTGEIQAGRGILFAHQFDALAERIDGAWPQIEQAYARQATDGED
jgi:hypothetical protein